MGVHGIARDLAAAGLGTLKAVEVAGDRGHLSLPDRDPHRRSRGLPGFLRPGGPRRAQRPFAGLAAAEAEGGRPAADQRAGRHDQLHHADLRPAAPRLRSRASLHGAIVARRARDGEEMLALNGKTYRLDPTMTVIADDARVHDIGGIMGGEHSGRHRGDHRHRHRMRIFQARAYRADRPEARPGLRRAQPLRARRRSRLRRDGHSSSRTEMAIELAGGEASEIVRAGTPPDARQGRRLSPGALRGAGRDRRARGPAGGDPAAARLRRDPRRRWRVGCRHGVATSTARPTSSRKSPASRAIDKVPSTPLPRAPGVAQPDRDRRAVDRAQGAADGRRARAQRGGDLELHRRGARPSRSAARPGSSPIRSARR